ncbi:hypothetical protein ACOZ4L_15890 (plasmid) [Haloplanus ruber]|uniref:Restriction endonuclease type IV Mrr domain-containing protein n=1 Tax=Haloplanus ruber TaxID=869892 RepID=A0ABD6D531_9EURY|nr:hypothetical protein [Haloplanus ruber]
MTNDESPIPNEYYEELHPLIETVESLRSVLTDDYTLSEEHRMIASRLFHTTIQSLKQARRILPNPDPGADTRYNRSPYEWDDYEDALEQIEHRLSRLLQYARREHPDEYRSSDSPKRKFNRALESITELRERLPAVSDESLVPDEVADVRTETNYAHADGRGQGQGQWLEYQLQRALSRWGYDADTRQTLFNLEVDVVACRTSKQQDPTDWLVAQCKDWTQDTVTPSDLFRLCTVAFACRAMPILCHTTELTPRTEELARYFEVRVLELDDLERGELPAPHVAKPTAKVNEWELQNKARFERGTFPLAYCNKPSKHFSYVPGFKPVGNGCEYEPVDENLDEDTHPASGH